MTVTQLAEKLGLIQAWVGWEDRNVSGASTSDLLSDVMAHADEGQILITIQAHKNTIAVAVLKDLSAIVIASNRPVPEDMIEAAHDEDVPIFVTSDNQYQAGWRIHGILEN